MSYSNVIGEPGLTVEMELVCCPDSFDLLLMCYCFCGCRDNEMKDKETLGCVV